jgi:hypothetical protein
MALSAEGLNHSNMDLFFRSLETVVPDELKRRLVSVLQQWEEETGITFYKLSLTGLNQNTTDVWSLAEQTDLTWVVSEVTPGYEALSGSYTSVWGLASVHLRN